MSSNHCSGHLSLIITGNIEIEIFIQCGVGGEGRERVMEKWVSLETTFDRSVADTKWKRVRKLISSLIRIPIIVINHPNRPVNHSLASAAKAPSSCNNKAVNGVPTTGKSHGSLCFIYWRAHSCYCKGSISCSVGIMIDIILLGELTTAKEVV